MVVRLPIPGSDDGSWGDILNTFLATEHNSDGTLKIRSDGTLSAKQSTSEKGQANGYAPLGSDGKVPSSYIPTSGSVPDADASTKGVIQLAGDLGGTAASPTVTGLSAKAEDVSVVHKGSTETISGDKNFTGALTRNGNAVILEGDARLTDQRTPSDNSVSTAKLQNGAVTSGKLSTTGVSDGQAYVLSSSSWTPTSVVASSLVGATNGVASLGSDGKVPTGQLPSGLTLPSQTGNAGRTLVTDGTNTSWARGVVNAALPPYNMSPSNTGAQNVTALNAAISAVWNSGSGSGAVYIPGGASINYSLNAGISIPKTVSLFTDAEWGATLTWTTDTGGGTFGLQLSTTSGVSYETPTIYGFKLVGPGNQGSALGVAPCAMGAVRLMDNGRLLNCTMIGWRMGVSFQGNHQKVAYCRVEHCYYGVWWSDGATTFSDQSITHTELVNQKFASIAVAGDSTIDTSMFDKVHMGFSPYGIYKESGGSFRKTEIANNTSFIDCSIEAVGNGMIYDEADDSQVRGCQFIGGYTYIMNATYKIAARNADYLVRCNYFGDNVMMGYRTFSSPADLGFFDCNTIRNCKHTDGWALISGITTSKPVAASTNDVLGFQIYGANGQECDVMKVAINNQVANDLLFAAPSQGNAASTAASGAGGSDIPVGILQAAANSGNWGVIAKSGRVTAKNVTAITGTTYVKADTSNRGSIVTATAGDTMIVGYVNGNGSSNSTQTLYLQGLA